MRTDAPEETREGISYEEYSKATNAAIDALLELSRHGVLDRHGIGRVIACYGGTIVQICTASKGARFLSDSGELEDS